MVRSIADANKIRDLMIALGHQATGPGRIYFTGGTSAVLYGWRTTTIDADLAFDPEPKGIFEAISRVKDMLDINIELAAPDQFIPPLPNWRERCVFIQRCGQVDFFHYDFYSQALAKVERGHARDLADVREMLRRNLVRADELRALLKAIEPELIRYPAIDAEAFTSKLEELLSSSGK